MGVSVQSEPVTLAQQSQSARKTSTSKKRQKTDLLPVTNGSRRAKGTKAPDVNVQKLAFRLALVGFVLFNSVVIAAAVSGLRSTSVGDEAPLVRVSECLIDVYWLTD